MKKIINKFSGFFSVNVFSRSLILFMLLSIIFSIANVYSQTPTTAPATPGGGGEGGVLNALACLICRVFNLIFYITSAIAALVIIVAGVKWIGSGDDPSARGAAKNTIVHAIIGLIIVLVAVFLVWWLVSGISGAQMVNPTSWISGCSDVCGA